MTELLYFILASCGLTQILVYGKIFDKLRPTKGWAGDLLSCPMCTGFWSGVFLWVTNEYTELFNYDFSLLTGLILGCIASGVSYIFAMIVDDDGLKLSGGGK